MGYYIPNLAKGLVDETSKGKLTEDYKQKCSELENFYIKANDNIARRPPLRRVEGFENISDIIDVKAFDDKQIFLRKLDLNDSSINTEAKYQERLTSFFNGAYPSWLDTIYNNALRTRLPELSMIDVYDIETKERLLDEVYLFMRYNPDSSHTTYKLTDVETYDSPLADVIGIDKHLNRYYLVVEQGSGYRRVSLDNTFALVTGSERDVSVNGTIKDTAQAGDFSCILSRDNNRDTLVVYDDTDISEIGLDANVDYTSVTAAGRNLYFLDDSDTDNHILRKYILRDIGTLDRDASGDITLAGAKPSAGSKRIAYASDPFVFYLTTSKRLYKYSMEGVLLDTIEMTETYQVSGMAIVQENDQSTLVYTENGGTKIKTTNLDALNVFNVKSDYPSASQVFNVTNTSETATRAKRFLNLLTESPDYLYIIKIDASGYFTDFISKSHKSDAFTLRREDGGVYFNSSPSNLILPLELRDGQIKHLADNSDIPDKIEPRESGIGFSAFGLGYTWNRSLVCDNSSDVFFKDLNLRENNLNSFPEKVIDTNLSKFKMSIMETQPFIDYSVNNLNQSYRVDDDVYDFAEFLSVRPELGRIRDYLKFALSYQGKGSGLDAGFSEIESTVKILPDIKITIPSTDVNAAGTFLYTLPNGDNVFVADHTYNALLKPKQISQVNNPPYLTSENLTDFPNQTGPAKGDLGVTLYIQQGNKTDELGEPVFYPVPTKFDSSDDDFDDTANNPTTVSVLYITLNYDDDYLYEFMDELKLISFYSSKGIKGFTSNGLAQITKPLRSTSYINRFIKSQLRINLGNGPDDGGHLIPWWVLDMSDFSYIYATNSEFKLGEYYSPDTLAIDSDDALLDNLDASPLSSQATRAAMATFSNSESTATEPNRVAELERIITLAEQARTELMATYSGRKGNLFSSYNSAERRNIQAYDRKTFLSRTRITVPFGSLPALPSSPGVSVGYLNPDLYTVPHDTPVMKTDDMTGRVYSFVRNAQSPDSVDSKLKLWRKELALRSVTGTSDTQTPYSTEFKVYDSISGGRFQAGTRHLLSKGKRNTFSKVGVLDKDTNIFSLGYKSFLNNVITTSKNLAYIRNADLGISTISDQDHVPTDPQSFIIESRLGDKSKTVDFIEYADKNLLVSNQKVFRVSNLSDRIRMQVELNSGVDTPVTSDSSTFIGGLGSVVKIMRYYEAIGGYVSDIANKETSIPGEINSIVSLLEKHKIVLFSLKNNKDKLYVLSIGESRSVKGFSIFSFGCEIERLVQLSVDKIGVLTSDCKYSELDFGKDFSDDRGYVDIDNEGNLTRYNSIMTTLPLLKLEDSSFSVFDSISLKQLSIGVTGHPAFNIRIIDNNSKRTKSKEYRRVLPGRVTEDSLYSGHLVIKGLPANGSPQPSLSITKDDDGYLELASIEVDFR